MTQDAVVLDTPDKIAAFRLLQQYYALKLETRGLHHSRGSVYAYVKSQYGFRGNKQSVLRQFADKLREMKLLRELQD